MSIALRPLLTITLILEGALAGSFFLWIWFRDLHPGSPFILNYFISGLLFTIPLLLLNYLIFGPQSFNFGFLKSFHIFKDQIVKPLVDVMDYKSAILISLAAGFGEELFFRGILQGELTNLFENAHIAILITSSLFSLLHFGPAVVNFPLVAFVYFVIGQYFGYMQYFTDTVWIPAITHTLYDYIAIIYLRYCYVSPIILSKDAQ